MKTPETFWTSWNFLKFQTLITKIGVSAEMLTSDGKSNGNLHISEAQRDDVMKATVLF